MRILIFKTTIGGFERFCFTACRCIFVYKSHNPSKIFIACEDNFMSKTKIWLLHINSTSCTTFRTRANSLMHVSTLSCTILKTRVNFYCISTTLMVKESNCIFSTTDCPEQWKSLVHFLLVQFRVQKLISWLLHVNPISCTSLETWMLQLKAISI